MPLPPLGAVAGPHDNPEEDTVADDEKPQDGKADDQQPETPGIVNLGGTNIYKNVAVGEGATVINNGTEER